MFHEQKAKGVQKKGEIKKKELTNPYRFSISSHWHR